MEVLSVQVGTPRDVEWRGRVVRTAIFKYPVEGPVMVRRYRMDGDRQAATKVHGGRDKAVYAYPSEHYPFWRKELPETPLEWGHFGENLTTRGLREDELQIGDKLRFGAALLQVTEPRHPCSNLNVRFDRPDMVKRFLASRLTGFYLTVLEEGEVAAGDSIELVERRNHGIHVSDITRLFAFEKDDVDGLRAVVSNEFVTDKWRRHFQAQLDEHMGGGS